jgi:hypothetical protein
VTTDVGTHGLTCLDDTDPAAIALSMQANAEAIDAALTGIDASLDAYLGRGWWSATNVGALNVANNSGSLGPENFVGVDFFGDSPALSIQTSGFPVIGTFPSTFDWPDGIYLCGSTVKWTVATPNNNTIRTLMVYESVRMDGSASISPPGPGGPIYMTTEYERGAAGNDGSLDVVGMFQVGADISRLGAFFSHTNTGSVLVVPTGGWRMWFIYLGSGLVV